MVVKIKDDGSEFVDHFASKTWANKDEADKLQEFKQMYNELYLPNFHIWTRMYARAYDHLALYCGDQMSPSEVEFKKNQRRSAFTWNHVYRNINTIAGYFEQTQLGYVVQSVSSDPNSTISADILNDCLRRVCYQEGVYRKISACVKDSAITGWSGLRAYVDHTPEGKGDIKVRQVLWNNMVIDPFFTQLDLSDCSYIAVRSLLPRAKLAAMFPDHAGLIMTMQANVTGDVKFPWSAESRALSLNHPDTLNYTEMYRMILKPMPHIFNPVTKEAVPWSGDKQEFAVMKQIYPEVRVENMPVTTIEYGILVEDHLVKFAENPYNINIYPIQPFFAIFEPSYAVDRKVNSLVSIIGDAQRSFNKRKNAMIDIMDTSLQSGVIYKEGAVLNPESLYMMRAGHNICVDRDVPMGEAIQQITSTDLPPSIFQAIRDLENDMNTLLGVNPEMFGQVQGGSTSEVEVSGVLYRMKQASALVGMQPFYALVRESQQLFGTMLLKMIQANYPVSKMEQISKKPAPPEVMNAEWARFNVVLQEGIIENRNANLEQKLALRSLGVPVSSRAILEASPIYDKASMIQYAEQVEAQEAQLREIQMQKEIKTIESFEQDLRSEASKNQASALNTLSSIGLKVAEKEEALARAQKIKADSVSQFAKVVEIMSAVDPQKLEMALKFLSQMSRGVEQSIEEKKSLCEAEADDNIARRLPPQELANPVDSKLEQLLGGLGIDDSGMDMSMGMEDTLPLG